MKMGKIYKIVKLVAFVTMGVLVLVFNKAIMSNEGAILNGLVGAVIAIYGLEGVILPIATRKVKQERVEMLNGTINILIAIVMIFLLEKHPDELRIVCVLWSVWSIMREGVEIFDKGYVGIKNHPVTSMINFAESFVVILFSIELICAKDFHELEHHAHSHVILLGIELIIEVIWVYMGDFESKILKKIRRKHNKEEKETLLEQQEEQKHE